MIPKSDNLLLLPWMVTVLILIATVSLLIREASLAEFWKERYETCTVAFSTSNAIGDESIRGLELCKESLELRNAQVEFCREHIVVVPPRQQNMLVSRR